MAENPYAAPHAHGAPSAASLAKAPDIILHMIMAGWIVAGANAAINLITAILIFATGHPSVGFGIVVSVDVVVMGALAYGVSRKSRVAALLLLGYYLLGRVLILITGNASNLTFAVLALLAYLAAAKGTFDYHRWLQQERHSPSSLRPRLRDDPPLRTPAAAATAPQPATAPASDPAPAATPPA